MVLRAWLTSPGQATRVARLERQLGVAFYGPGDWLAERTTPRLRRAVSAWVALFWLGPGFVLWLWLRDALWFVGLMSVVALWLSGLGMVAAETPVERQDGRGARA